VLRLQAIRVHKCQSTSSSGKKPTFNRNRSRMFRALVARCGKDLSAQRKTRHSPRRRISRTSSPTSRIDRQMVRNLRATSRQTLRSRTGRILWRVPLRQCSRRRRSRRSKTRRSNTIGNRSSSKRRRRIRNRLQAASIRHARSSGPANDLAALMSGEELVVGSQEKATNSAQSSCGTGKGKADSSSVRSSE
jgi:hypothetical protein